MLQPLQDCGPLRKFDEGLGATLSQMYSSSVAQSAATPSSSSSPNGTKGVSSSCSGVGTPGQARPSGGGQVGGGSNNNNSSGGGGSSSSTIQNSANFPASGGGNNNSSSDTPVFNLTTGRRESPLDLSVKTVRQSADSSTSSLAVIDGQGGGGSNGSSTTSNGGTANRSHSSSGSSTPNLSSINTNHLHSATIPASSTNVGTVIAAVANSTTSSPKEAGGHGAGLSSGESKSGASSTSSSSASGGNNPVSSGTPDRSSSKSRKNLIPSNVPNNSNCNSTTNSGNSGNPEVSVNPAHHHLFGGHPSHGMHPPVSQHHPVHGLHGGSSSVRSVAHPFPGQNAAAPHPAAPQPLPSAPPPPFSSGDHHHHHLQQQQSTPQQPTQQPPRPSSAIPSYNPGHLGSNLPTYHHQYHQGQGQPPPHHTAYHNVGYPTYHPHFPAQSSVGHHPPPAPPPGPGQHLNYYSSYGHSHPSHTPVSAPPPSQAVQNSSNSSTTPRDSTPQTVGAGGNPSAGPPLHSQMNYPAPKSMPAPLGSHYPTAATPGPQSFAAAFAHGLSANGHPPPPHAQPPYYATSSAAPSVSRPSPQDTPNPGQHPQTHYTHAGPHMSQYVHPYGHYAGQSPYANYHHHHQQQHQQQQQSSLQSQHPQAPGGGQSSGKANPSYPSSVVGSSAGMTALSRQSIPGRPHPGVGNVMPSYPSTPNHVGSADPHRAPHISNHLHHPPPPTPQQQQQQPQQQPSVAANNTSVQPPPQAVPNVPGPPQSKAAKGGQPRGSFGGREGKTSSRKNLLSLLRNSCENRIHEKQEKEKFQFNHQTWNFHGRKFNTVLPPLTSSNSSASSASNVNQNSSAGSLGTDSNNIPGTNNNSGGSSGKHVATPASLHVHNGSNNGSPNSNTKQKMLDPYSSSSSALTSLQMKSEKDSHQLLSDGSSAANSYHSLTALNRIRTKAEKKQLFPNLLSQIEQENSSRGLGQGATTPSLPSSSSFAAVDSSEGRNHFHLHSHSSKPPTSVFDFEDDDDVGGGGSSRGAAVNSIKTVKKSPAKRLSTGSNKREKDSNNAALLPDTAKATAAGGSEINNSIVKATTVEIPTAVGAACNSAVNPTVLKSEQQDNGDSFWAACDSFLSDLASNPQTIKSRRGGLWQKLKGKSSASANNSKSPSANAKVKRTLKNSSEEDSDFKVEDDEDDDDKSEEEEEEEEEDDDEDEEDEVSSSVRENGVVDSVSEEASESKSVASESNKVSSVLKRKKLRDSSASSQRKRRKLSPESVKKSSLRSSTTKNNNNSSVCKNKIRASLASNKKTGKSSRRRTSSPEISSRNHRRRLSARRPTRGRIISDDDDDNDNDGTSSVGSESEDENSEEDSDSSQSFSVDSSSDSVENYDSSSDDDSDDSDSDSEDSEDDDDFDLDSNSLSSGAVRKSRRRLRNSKENAKSSSSKKKSLRSSSKSMSLRRKSNRSSSKKNKKSSKKKNKKDSKRGRSQRRLRNSVKTRSLRKSRPKRNCAPVAGKGRLKDISGESDEEERQDGSSGEEWIMRGELGKKKRRIVFGDGSDFRRPGWEEELIDFKKKLRMPSKLIRVAKPSSMSALGGSRGENSSSSSIKDNNETEKDVKDVVVAKDSSSNNKENSDKESATKKSKARASKTSQKSEDKTTKIANTATNAASSTISSPAKSVASKGKGKITKDEEKSSQEKDDKEKEKAKEGKKSATTGKEEKTRTPNKKSGKKEKEVAEKGGEEADAPDNGTNSGKKDEDRYTKLAKEKEAQMLPTPGAAGNKFNKKMSIKSVFGVDLPSSATPAAAEVSSNSSTTTAAATAPALSTTNTATTTVAATVDKPAPVKKILRRNKFKSGFDYIRKKKRVTATPDGVEKPPAPKRIKTNENKVLKVEDVQAEVRSWVLNKGLGETVLHRAARLGYPDIASYCLEHDMCSPNSKDNAGYSPLHETCIKGHLEVAKVLLAYGANPSQAAPGGIRPLHEACENGHVELVRLLVAYGADPLLATYAGQSPLELAEPHKEVRHLLEEHIMDVQGKQNKPWVFRGSGKWAEEQFDCGFQVTDAAPSPEEPADPDAFEFEASENTLPPLYRLKGETSFYVLLQDLLNYIGQPKDRFLKSNPSADMVELNSNDFLEQAHCCHLLGERFNLNSSSDLLTLIKYDDRVKKMLNIESVFIK